MLNTIKPPVSKTVQRLLAQIHAEAQAATLTELSAKDGIVALQGCDSATVRVRCDDDFLEVCDRSGFSVRAWRHRFCPEQWKGTRVPHHPSYWHVYETRTDGNGVSWSRDSAVCVVDDFGTLVPVQGVAA